MSGREPRGGPITRRRLIGGATAGAAAAALLEPAGRLAGLRPVSALAAADVTAAGSGGEWLAGDLHTHTWYSHDVLRAGGPDDNTGLEDFYTVGYDVTQRFEQARDRGLDFLAVTDHDDVRSFADPGFGSAGVVGIPAYEASIGGHAQVLGAARSYPKGDGSLAAAERLADAIRADGGLFQANHPAYRLDQPYVGCGCGSCGSLHWKYGLDLRPDTVEVWNAASPPNAVAEEFWECWLDLGERIAATGGSDGHWQTTNEVAGPGQPTTWVHARERSARGVLDAIRGGRTAIAAQPPARGGSLPLLEGGAGFTALPGDEVAPGTPLRVRMEPALLVPVTVRVRANGGVLLERELAPGGELRFDAPGGPGWVRALVLADERGDGRAASCRIAGREVETLNCRDGKIVIGLTSPIYVVAPVTARPVAAPPPAPAGGGSTAPPPGSDGNRWPDEDAVAPGGGAATPERGAAAPGEAAVGLRIAVARSVGRAGVVERGLRVGVAAGRPGRVKVRLVVGGRTVVSARRRLDRAGRVELRLRPEARLRRRLPPRRVAEASLEVRFTKRAGRQVLARRRLYVVP